ncbi:hypothetical protein A2331_06560 [Candidatus Falkowbacteria bacterium RIFOXYB2_FULL_34_18]|uniref:Uncharacterized protein n=1 Tax=Candidatus Falkowbacteria bacterium RIFOXYD2_FULL_34_120 TaxID=1798007 RepID=A0A1F5TRA7_9BACT|nr:MAG: hypothetical protein A2331_06560 [Candidatus Falkowbacteria bacterium RIFOXYB2_FULL_34_18]OGF30018.1 MAG: hypothetical protein A2500_04125 [Candidatus Falkowbacteria bacterium RIFOXYC12_FULL_34_55]OGF37125.1 MAG: hypothetical protein A2466_02395 [Candidatus Falkowbacteria bacterium RIFOXYC2_FULL_34_220]OGF39554.1 MAG: hypothetical protein A2515_04490 [Candidatus Falkowbacteria bacterium RIFOXYD12_FULL_34_57]OGF41463.1 MAG: hypothetical protein A2531_02110 [Candidatus Falkowbacteria bact
MPKKEITNEEILHVMHSSFNDVDNRINMLEEKMNDMGEKMNDMGEKMNDMGEKMNEKFDQVLTAVDALACNNKKFDQELTANRAAHDRIQNDVNEVRKYVKMDIKNSILRDGE